MTKKADIPSSMYIQIDISRQNDQWPQIDGLLQNAIRTALSGTNYKAETEISLVLADDVFVQALNKQYREKDKPTNVLSFPQDEEFSLGDIIMALETIQKEAEDQNKKFEDHAVHLAVHGTLHLLGFDHETDDEAAEMETLEIKILNSIGLKNPYETSDTPINDV